MTTTWRPLLVSRIGCLLVGVMSLAPPLGIWVLARFEDCSVKQCDGDPVLANVLATVCLVSSIAFFAAASSYLRLDEEGVSYRNLFRRRFVELAAIRSVEASYSGIVLHLHGRRSALAIAVQESNLMAVLPRTSRAERVVATIEAALPDQSPPGTSSG